MDLLRLVQPGRWSRLEGDALVALDFRISAEMLLLFHEHLASRQAIASLAEPSERFREPMHDRLKPDRSALDRVLSDFGLSPHPGVVLVVEGDSEMALLPRVLEELGIPQGPGLLRLFGAGGRKPAEAVGVARGVCRRPLFRSRARGGRLAGHAAHALYGCVRS